MSNGPLQIKAISGHAGTPPGLDASRDYQVAKLIDVTTCIGCKACEVACLEWNGYPFRETVFDNTYQTMPDTEWNYYNLIRFNEHVADDGTLSWLMRKDQCMHCADPGCLRACPADQAIVQYANGIVDFQEDACIGCGYCQTGQMMQAASLLKEKPKPTDQEIDSAMQGNICRCGTYQRIRLAIKLAADVNVGAKA